MDEILKEPPRSNIAELGVLTAICWRNEAMDDVAAILDEGHFYSTAHKLIFRSMFALHSAGERVDLVTLGQKLKAAGDLANIGGLDYLAKLLNTASTSANAEYYARIVLDKAHKRALISICHNTLAGAYEDREDALTLISEADSQIVDIGVAGENDGPMEIAYAVREAVDSVDKAYMLQKEGRGSELAASTRLPDLDSILGGGLWRQEYTILAARPSDGKTSLALNIAENVAMGGHGVLFFSAEMPARVLVGKMAAVRAGISWYMARQGKLSEHGFSELMRHGGEMYSLPIRIDDKTRNIRKVAAHVRATARDAKFDLRLVILDYLQLYNSGKRERVREREIASMSQALADLRSTGVHILALAQLNRISPDKAKTTRPSLDRLRESGSLEQDADNVLLIFPAGKHGCRDPETQVSYEESYVELAVAKQRLGPTGKVELNFIRELQRFECFSKQPEPEPEGENDDDDELKF